MKKILFGFVILFEINCFSQQLPQFTQFINNTSLFNPSMMGMENDALISVGGRWQMLGFGSEPRTAFICGQTRISNKSKRLLNPSLRISKDNTENDSVKQTRFSHYAGGQLLFDSYGAFNRTSLNGLYSMSIDLNPDWKLLAGLKFAYSNFGFDMTKAQVAQNTDIDQEYDSYIANGSNRNSFDLSAGFTLVSKNYFIGFAANQFTKTSLDLNTSNSYFDQRMHWNLITGYTYAIPGIVDFQGMILLKKNGSYPTINRIGTKSCFTQSTLVWCSFQESCICGLHGRFYNRK